MVSDHLTAIFFAVNISSSLYIFHFNFQRNVITTKNAEKISFPLSLMTVFNCLSWLYYGYLIKDTFVQVGVMHFKNITV